MCLRQREEWEKGKKMIESEKVSFLAVCDSATRPELLRVSHQLRLQLEMDEGAGPLSLSLSLQFFSFSFVLSPLCGFLTSLPARNHEFCSALTKARAYIPSTCRMMSSRERVE